VSYLPTEIKKAKVLITVKTYPNPSVKYDELVCNAGFLESGEWIRIYPINFRGLPYDQQYKKYNWIELDLVRRSRDFRPESYSPKLGLDENVRNLSSVGTGRKRDWAARKSTVLNEVFDSMTDLIKLSKERGRWKSLATVKPKEIIKFEIKKTSREWSQKTRDGLMQMKLFSNTPQQDSRELNIVRKLPYTYYYHFLTEDGKVRRMMIEDWEIGALYWSCLKQTKGDEAEANKLVQKKYAEEFLSKDLYLFVGTTLANQIRAPNPFVIIGVFPPPISAQTSFDF
jgi:hypothetical protein